jgi:hypothetical protein
MVPSVVHHRQIALDYTIVRQPVFIASQLNVMWKGDLIDEPIKLFWRRSKNCMKTASIVFGFLYLKIVFEFTFPDEMLTHHWNAAGYKQHSHNSTFINIQLCQVLYVYFKAEINALGPLLFPSFSLVCFNKFSVCALLFVQMTYVSRLHFERRIKIKVTINTVNATHSIYYFLLKAC